MRRIKVIFCLSILALVICGVLFVRGRRYGNTVTAIENLTDKTVLFYSSTFKKTYVGSLRGQIDDLDRLCVEGADYLTKKNINAAYAKMNGSTQDPYTASGLQLDKLLKKDREYILVDVTRGDTKHGKKYSVKDKTMCPMAIVISRKSKNYESSVLFAGRIKELIDRKYPGIQVQLITTDVDEFNQSKGYMGLLLEIGDAANTYDEARESISLICDAAAQVIGSTH